MTTDPATPEQVPHAGAAPETAAAFAELLDLVRGGDGLLTDGPRRANDEVTAVEGYLRQTLLDRLAAAPPGSLDRAMSMFMGEAAPHAWPIHAAELEALGIPVENAEPAWSALVDGERRAQRRALPPWEGC